MRALVLPLVVCLAACGPLTVLEAKHYKQTCTEASECTAVFFGDVCEPCACPNGALNAEVKVTYDADRTAAQRACGPVAAIACAPCQDRAPACTHGTCGLP